MSHSGTVLIFLLHMSCLLDNDNSNLIINNNERHCSVLFTLRRLLSSPSSTANIVEYRIEMLTGDSFARIKLLKVSYQRKKVD